MSIKFDGTVKQNNIGQTVGTNHSGSQSGSQPIDMKMNSVAGEENKQKELEYINSAEFKNCPDEDKLSLLKHEFSYLSKYTDGELNKYLTQLKSASEQEPIESDSQSEVSEGEQVIEVSEFEQLVEKYCKDNNIKDLDIDKVIASLKSKKMSGQLSEIEQRILDLHDNALIENVELVDLNEYYTTDEHNHQVPTSKFQDLSTNKKIQISVQNYLEKSDEDFANLSKTEKQQLVAKNCNDLLAIINKNYKEASNERVLQQQSYLLIAAAKEQNISLEQLKSLDKSELDAILNSTKVELKSEVNNEIGESVKAENTDNRLGRVDEKLYIQSKVLMKNILSTDSEFKKLTSEEQDKRTQEMLEMYFDKELSKYSDEVKEKDTIALRNLNRYLENLMASNGEKSIQKLDSYFVDPMNLLKDEENLLNSLVNTATNEDDKNTAERQLRLNRFEQYVLSKYGNNPISKYDSKSMNDILNQIISDNDTPQEMRTMAKLCQHELNKQNDCKSGGENILSQKSRLSEHFRNLGIDFMTSSDELFKKAEKLTSEEKQYYYEDLLNYAVFTKPASQKFEVNIVEAMKKDGFSDDVIKEMLNSTERFYNDYATAQTPEETAEVVRRYESADKNARNVVAKNFSKYEKTPEGQAVVIKAFDEECFESVATGLNLHNTTDQTTEVFGILANDKEMSCANLTNLTENVIETAQDDQHRVDLATNLTKLGSTTILEGVAAGSDSIQDKNYQTQYNVVVTDAAKNYSPEVQQNIQTVLTTGEISTQTKTNSEPAVKFYYADADTYTAPKSTASANSNVVTSQSARDENPAVYYRSNNTPQNAVPTQQVYTGERNVSTGNIVDSAHPVVHSTVNTISSSSSSNVDNKQVREEAIANQIEANQKIKDIALDNVAKVKNKIEESIAEWELKQELKLSDEVIEELKESATTEALVEYIQENPTQKEVIISQLMNAETISDVYDILYSNLGSKVHQKFIDALASYGSSGAVRSFIKSKAGNTDIIKELLIKTTNDTLRNELIGMLPAADVIELLEKNLITNLDGVDYKILYQYLSSNIYSMTQTNFANYLKYLPFDEREKLVEMRNMAYGIQSANDTAQPNNESVYDLQTQGLNDEVTENHQVATNPQNRGNSLGMNNSQSENPQTKFAAGETRKTLSDGRVITNQGTTFAGVSNNLANDEGYRIIEPKLKVKEGSPIGMNDDVLTPGSAEWMRKYNKQATVAFTMSALEEQEEFLGGSFGSNRVKKGQPIKKKYNPNSFNVRT